MVSIGIIGGTGELGTGIALHLARNHQVFLGSRGLENAKKTVEKMLVEKGTREYLRKNLIPAENHEAIKDCRTLILTVPYQNAIGTVTTLKQFFSGDQILVSAVAPVVRVENEFQTAFDLQGRSVSQQIRNVLPISVRIATAFQSVPAHILYEERPISSDVLVTCDESSTYEEVAALISDINGLRPLYLGSLNLSGEVERMTALILNIAIKNKLKSPTPKFNSF